MDNGAAHQITSHHSIAQRTISTHVGRLNNNKINTALHNTSQSRITALTIGKN
jgi:hypothetical protein